MAIAFVQSTIVTGSAVTSVTTPNISTTSGNLLVADMNYYPINAFSSLTDSASNTWATSIAEQAGVIAVSGRERYAKNITGNASHTATLTLTGSGYCNLILREISGADTSSPLDKTATLHDSTLGSTSHDSSNTATTSQANELLLGFGWDDGFTAQSLAASSPWTQGEENDHTATELGIIVGRRTVSSTGAYSFVFASSAEVIGGENPNEYWSCISTWKDAGVISASITATESSDVVAITAANWTTAQIAASESADVAAIAVSVTTGASIAASESSDVAAIAAQNWTTAQIAALESSDTAAVTASAIMTVQIAALESSDTAALAVGVTTGAAIAATESPDSASIIASDVTSAQIIALESSDTAALVAEVTTGAVIVASESSDTATITASAITSAQIAASESSDTASVSAEVTTGAAISASESSDTASITANTIATAQIVAVESSDTTSISAEATTSAAIAATESSDTAAIVADATGVLSAAIAATESSDTASIAAGVTTGAAIDARESPDSASIVGFGGAVDFDVVVGPAPPRRARFVGPPLIARIQTGQGQTLRATVTLKLVVPIRTAQVQSIEAIADQSVDLVAVTNQAHRIGGFSWMRMLTSARSSQAPLIFSAALSQEMQTKIESGMFDRQIPSYDAPERIVFREVA